MDGWVWGLEFSPVFFFSAQDGWIFPWILNDYMDESGTHGLNWSVFNVERCGWNT